MLHSEFLQSVPISIADTLLSSRPITDGEPVKASVANRLPRTNAMNMAYIHDLIRRFRDLSGEYLWQMPIAEDVRIGDFVYYSPLAYAFKKGLAHFVLAGESVQESETSLVWGVVIDIRDGKADICTNGLCEFKPTTDTYASQDTPGVRFLSSTVYGGITAEVSVPHKCVGFMVGVKATGEVQFFVRPYLSVDGRAHQHCSAALAAAPAGDWVSAAATVTNEDISIPGWLSAANPIFAGKAPAGALYGYNPNFLTGCHWPIRTPSSAGLRWQRTADQIPLLAAVPPELYTIDETTIWWNSNVFLPWASHLDYVAGQAAAEASEYAFRVWLEVLNTGYDIEEATVTTLRASKAGGLYVRQYPYGGPAVSGDLEVGLDLSFDEEIVPEGMGHAVGTISGNRLRKSPILSKLRINSRVMRAQSQFFDGQYHYGAVTLSDPTGIAGAEVPIEATHLNGVEEVLTSAAAGLAFSKDRSSSLLTQMLIPYDDLFTSMSLSVRLGILIMRPGSVPADILKLFYTVIKNPSGSNTAVEVPPQGGMSSLSCDCSLLNSTFAHAYYVVESGKVPVSPGDIFVLKIERRSPDGFADRIVLLRKSGILSLT